MKRTLLFLVAALATALAQAQHRLTPTLRWSRDDSGSAWASKLALKSFFPARTDFQPISTDLGTTDLYGYGYLWPRPDPFDANWRSPRFVQREANWHLSAGNDVGSMIGFNANYGFSLSGQSQVQSVDAYFLFIPLGKVRVGH